MTTDTVHPPLPSQDSDKAPSKKRKRRTLQYVSRHFVQPQAGVKSERRSTKRRKLEDDKENDKSDGQENQVAPVVRKSKADLKREESVPAVHKSEDDDHIDTTAARRDSVTPRKYNESKAKPRKKTKTQVKAQHIEEEEQLPNEPATVHDSMSTVDAAKLVPWQQVLAALPEERQSAFQNILCGIEFEDSDLTDVPEDIGPDPFALAETERKSKKSKAKKVKTKPELVAIKEEKRTPPAKAKPRSGLTKSPYFPHPHKQRDHFLSTLPFPPLHLERFGLMQERLCHDPFRLLLATIFLNKTPGARAMPIFYKLMEKYPTPEKLAQARQADVTEIIRELGFQNQRAAKCIAMSAKWVEDPPVKGRRWRKLGYPAKGDGKDVKADEAIDDTDPRVAWEISHLPGLGPYSHDSWRMFCRDELRGLATAYDGEGAEMHGNVPFEPEWKRVLPMDKELRAWMTWMWCKEGFVWDKITGEKTKASEELMKLARAEGNVLLESEASTLQVKSLDEDKPTPLKLDSKAKSRINVEVPAGEFIPSPG
ncbi:hypothetical protein LTS08_006003 [Lithohypha guttulata]|uniref:uncharacterized protein n=1 Tax=Lithohypha guttulata TaxID=1690604 RepID=UPI002DE0C4E9|nr:hypothetical protein LTR51_002517 [Lithohypha guttulata]KAK5099421.1 hypothetical protein LTS08_006003 [Lithohypha guttulata]